MCVCVFSVCVFVSIWFSSYRSLIMVCYHCAWESCQLKRERYISFVFAISFFLSSFHSKSFCPVVHSKHIFSSSVKLFCCSRFIANPRFEYSFRLCVRLIRFSNICKCEKSKYRWMKTSAAKSQKYGRESIMVQQLVKNIAKNATANVQSYSKLWT